MRLGLNWLRLQRGTRHWASAVGVLGAAALFVNANLLVSRFSTRWDVTREQLYSVSDATRATLSGLSEPVDVVVLLGRADPLSRSIRQLLSAYRAETPQLNVRYLDPEQSPAEFLALAQRYGIISGKAEDGRVVTDASVVIAQGERHWFITQEQMLGFDLESGNLRPALEQALTLGIANVRRQERDKVCFSRGHGELSLFDAGPDGLLELRERLTKNNYETEERDLPGAQKPLGLEGCRLAIVAGPSRPFEEAASRALLEALRSGTSALLLLSPMTAEDGRISSSGLEAVVSLAEVELARDLVIETDSSVRLPRGLGEVFFATPKAHEVTRGLLKGGAKLELRVLLSQAQSMRVTGAATSVLVSSDQAFSLRDVRPLLSGQLEDTLQRNTPGQRTLAVAREISKAPAPGSPRAAGGAPTRMLLVGAHTPIQNRSFRDSGLYGNRMLIENAVSWLAARPALVSVPEKPVHEVGLALSEESVSEILRYVMIYMPGSVALVALLVLWRRYKDQSVNSPNAEPGAAKRP